MMDIDEDVPDSTEAASTHISDGIKDSNQVTDSEAAPLEEDEEESPYIIDHDGSDDPKDGLNLADEFESDDAADSFLEDDKNENMGAPDGPSIVSVSDGSPVISNGPAEETAISTDSAVDCTGEPITVANVTATTVALVVPTASSSEAPPASSIASNRPAASTSEGKERKKVALVPGSTITCASGRKIRLPKVFQPLHKSALKDLHSDGTKKMREMDIANARKRAKRREQRQREIERKL